MVQRLFYNRRGSARSLSRADLSYRSIAPLATYEGWRRCNRSPSQRWVDRSPSTRL